MWGLSGPAHMRTPHFTGEVNDGVIQGAYRRFTAPGMTYHCQRNMPGRKPVVRRKMPHHPAQSGPRHSSDTRRADQEHVSVLTDKVRCGQFINLSAIDAGIEAKVEVRK